MADLPKNKGAAPNDQLLVEDYDEDHGRIEAAISTDLADDFTDDDEIEDDDDPSYTLEYADEPFPEDWTEEDVA